MILCLCFLYKMRGYNAASEDTSVSSTLKAAAALVAILNLLYFSAWTWFVLKVGHLFTADLALCLGTIFLLKVWYLLKFAGEYLC